MSLVVAVENYDGNVPGNGLGGAGGGGDGAWHTKTHQIPMDKMQLKTLVLVAVVQDILRVLDQPVVLVDLDLSLLLIHDK